MSDDNEPVTTPVARRRRTDFDWSGCKLCAFVTKFWDWIDDRNIDQHAVSLFVLYGTWVVTRWAMAFASEHPGMSGIEMAAVIGAVVAPYMALQAAVIKWYFARGD